MKNRFYAIDTMALVLRNAGFDGLTCDPDAHDCNGCSFDLVSPHDCFNPDCHGGYAWELDDGRTVYKERRPPR